MQPTFFVLSLLVLLLALFTAGSSPTQMRALVMTDYGGADVFKLDEVAIPTPAERRSSHPHSRREHQSNRLEDSYRQDATESSRSHPSLHPWP